MWRCGEGGQVGIRSRVDELRNNTFNPDGLGMLQKTRKPEPAWLLFDRSVPDRTNDRGTVN